MPPIDGLIYKGLPPPLKSATNFLIFNVLWCFVAAQITQNYSHVDRVWSFLPTVYSILYTFYPLLDSAPIALQQQGVQPRALIITALQILWSLRLGYHTARRGYFSWNHEDYRWSAFRNRVDKTPILRRISGLVLTLFNFIFLSLFQNILLAMLALPTYSASVSTEPLHYGDALLIVMTLTALIVEFVSDNQQFAYQTFKQTGKLDLENEWPGSRIKFTQADRQRGFITKGLWAYSRHPNCASEQAVWWCMTLFPLLTNPHLANNLVDMLRVLSPSLVLSLLFVASTLFTESISASRYPSYKLYQKRVGMFWPMHTLIKVIWLRFTGKKEIDQLLWSKNVSISSKKAQ